MAIDGRTPLPKEITTLIERKAHRLARRYRLNKTDRPGIEQEITCKVLHKRSQVDENRARDIGFLITLVNNAVADLIAARKAAKRDYRREEGSLDTWHWDLAGGWLPPGDAVTEDDARRHRGRLGRSKEERRDLHIDVRAVLALLPAAIRVVAELYMELGEFVAVARARGRNRSTISAAVKRIRRHFEEAGLAEYFA